MPRFPRPHSTVKAVVVALFTAIAITAFVAGYSSDAPISVPTFERNGYGSVEQGARPGIEPVAPLPTVLIPMQSPQPWSGR